jgi:hypothetical protein
MSMLRTWLTVLMIASAWLASPARAVIITLADGTVVTVMDPTATSYSPLNGITGLGEQGVPVPVAVEAGSYAEYFTGGTDATLGVYYATNTNCNPCGGGVLLYATYQFVYGGPAATTTATVQAADTLASNAPSPYGDAYLVIGAPDQPFVYQTEDCFGTMNCVTGAPSNVHGPLADATITLEKDVVYTVQMWADVEPSALGYWASAEIDPAIALSAGSPGQLYFSDGMSPTDTPEPGSLTLLATGVAGLLWRRRARGR